MERYLLPPRRSRPQGLSSCKIMISIAGCKPVCNKAECRKCHGSRAAYNGSIVIDFSLDKVLEHVRREMITAGTIMLLALLFTGSCCPGALWHLLVEQRLNSMVNKIRQVKEGIYDTGRGAGRKR